MRDDPAWRERVRSAAAALGVALSPDAADRMGLHGDLLIQWNRKVNLTRITDPAEVAVKHFADALSPAPFLPPEARMLDIGAGGGFPGIPLSVVMPGLRVTLIDAVRKKASFMQHVIRTLGLANADARHVRAEALAGADFDLAVCRALADLPEILRLARPLVRPGGRIIALKARLGQEESALLGALETEGISVGVRTYALPFLGDPRTLITLALPA